MNHREFICSLHFGIGCVVGNLVCYPEAKGYDVHGITIKPQRISMLIARVTLCITAMRSCFLYFSQYQRSPGPETSRRFEYAVKSPVRITAFTVLLCFLKSVWGIVSTGTSGKMSVMALNLVGLTSLVSLAMMSFSTEKWSFSTSSSSRTVGLSFASEISMVLIPSGIGNPASQTISSSMCPIIEKTSEMSLFIVPVSLILSSFR